jgi:NADH-quinone oxidoreductase subunit C
MEDKLRAFFQDNFADSLIKEDLFRGDLSFYVKKDTLFNICQALHEDAELDIKLLADITSVDWLNHENERDGRFEISYNLYSLKHKYRFFLKVHLDSNNPEIDSVIDIWAGANWMEREVYDMMGIKFIGHPDLRKILTPDDLEGHPLRRDFPLTWEQPKFTWNLDDPPEVIK